MLRKLRQAVLPVLLLAAVTAPAGTLRFRSGEILGAELASRAPGNFKPDREAFGELPQSCAYALLSVKLDRGRGVSIYDYSLKFMGRDYPCIALAPEGRTLDAATWNYAGNEGARCALLFAIDESVISDRSVLSLALKCNVPAGGEVEVPFTILRGGRFTPLDKIPQTGSLPVPELK